jgi:hypothetical protein
MPSLPGKTHKNVKRRRRQGKERLRIIVHKSDIDISKPELFCQQNFRTFRVPAAVIPQPSIFTKPHYRSFHQTAGFMKYDGVRSGELLRSCNLPGGMTCAIDTTD